MASPGIAATLAAATRLVLAVSRFPNFLVAALRFLMALSCVAILLFRASVTVATPRAVVINPDTAALKTALVRVSILVASRPSMVQVSSRRFVQVIMIDRFPSFGTVVL